jgi:hypothetical protein
VPVPADDAAVEVPMAAFAAFGVAVVAVVPVPVAFVAVPVAELATDVAVPPGLIWPLKIS